MTTPRTAPHIVWVVADDLGTFDFPVGIGRDTVGVGVFVDIAGQRQGADQQKGWQ